MKKYTFIIGVLCFLFSCNQTQTQIKENSEVNETSLKLVKEVMTKEKQSNMKPEEVLLDLLEGNKRYTSGELIKRDLPTQISSTAKAQYPKATILACIDSRVPVEYIFDQGIGDIFVVRVAGNIEDETLLGSMEYGLAVAGSKLLMVLGHQNCGAVKSAIKKVDVGSENVTSLLEQIEPAINQMKGERNADDKEYFSRVIKNNVNQTIEDIRNRSSIISNLEREGKIRIVGAYYSLEDGKVTVLKDRTY